MKERIKIAIFSPSSPGSSVKMTDSGLEVARQYLPTADFIPEGPLSNPGLPYLAREDRQQAENFSNLLARKDLDYIWFVRGGYGSIRWLGLVEWPEGPLPIPIGFSDATSILNSVVARGGRAIHGPMLGTLTDTFAWCRNQLFDLLTGVNRKFEWHGAPLLPGTAAGTLAGGNLATIVSTLGTPLEPPWEECLLFLEDYQEPLYKLDRMLTQLLLSRRLEKVAGIILGQFLSLGEDEVLLKDLLLDRLGVLDVPVVWQIPAGHGPANEPLVLGARYELDGGQGRLVLIGD